GDLASRAWTDRDEAVRAPLTRDEARAGPGSGTPRGVPLLIDVNALGGRAGPAAAAGDEVVADERVGSVVPGRDVPEGDARAVHVGRVDRHAGVGRSRRPHRRGSTRTTDREPACLALVAGGVIDRDAGCGIGVERDVGRRAFAAAVHGTRDLRRGLRLVRAATPT